MRTSCVTSNQEYVALLLCFGNSGRATGTATALRAILVFAIHTPRAWSALGAPLQLEGGSVGPDACTDGMKTVHVKNIFRCLN